VFGLVFDIGTPMDFVIN